MTDDTNTARPDSVDASPKEPAQSTQSGSFSPTTEAGSTPTLSLVPFYFPPINPMSSSGFINDPAHAESVRSQPTNSSAHFPSPDPQAADCASPSPSEVDNARPFSLMITLLDYCRIAGNPRMLRGTLAIRLVQQNPQVYKQAGVQKFKEYAALAEKRGIVELGGSQGDAWISLLPKWYRRGRSA
jgi:hypothetical protein